MADSREPIAALPPTPRVAADADSRLRSVFLQHQLVAGLPRLPGVAPTLAKFVVGQIVDRLLDVPGGLEPLMLLQRDPALLARSTAVAVYAVLFARAAGWPDERLADHGAAAMLHGLGRVLDDGAAARAGFAWLAARGCSDFWLRAALVARHACGGAADETLPVGVATVRLAHAVLELLELGETGLPVALVRHPAAADVAPELLELAAAVLAGGP
ncbi:MAG: hypothetical protein JNK15_03335 [Planctomycetes bacterium]|nr:hypothetical protein [Planctomycetota bacterium]